MTEVLRPSSAPELSAAIVDLRSRGGRAVVRGGGTLLRSEAATVIDTTGLKGTISHQPADLVVTCGAGTTLAELDSVLSKSGQWLPVLHPAPGAATVGGLAAYGWTGLGRRLYGALRDRVLEVRAVTGEGRAIRGGGKVVKNVTGFDLPRLFCGSMGTLGVIHELTFKVHPRPRPLYGRSERGADPDTLAGMLLESLTRARMPAEGWLVRDGDGWAAHLLAPGPRSDAEALLGPGLEEADRIASRLGSDHLTTEGVRVSVPPARSAELAERLRGCSKVLMDVGSGCAWTDATDAVRWAEQVGGSRPPAPTALEIMRRIKRSFDPDGILGAGPWELEDGRP